MDYRGFHLRLTLPLTALLAAFAWPSWTAADTLWTAAVCAIVVVSTSPWDNWAVRRGVWDFPEDRVLFRIGACPVEEYAFFVIQTWQGALLSDRLIALWPGAKSPPHWEAAALVCAASAAALWCGRALWRGRSTYLWHLLAWTLPVIALQWCVGGIWAGHAAAVLATSFILGTVLCAFDIVAIRRGIWYFDEAQTLGLRLFGCLPIEEALFFYITSLLVAQSYALLAV